MPGIVEKLLAIAGLLVLIGVVVARLPKIDVGHSRAFRARRIRNWMPVGLLYAFMYMARYNLTVSKGVFEDFVDASGRALMTNTDFGIIFGVGTAVYGFAFVFNGPLTDRIGGKKALMIGGAGTLAANVAMGAVALSGHTDNLRWVFSWLYAINMYFQSFGAVSVVKINAPWFHVRERGTFGAIFGILISLGIFFAFDGGAIIVDALPVPYVFFIPALLVGLAWLAVAALTANTPAEAGFDDFDTADASSGQDAGRLPVLEVFRRMLTSGVIMTIASIEFCSGFLRQALMQWYKTFAKATGQIDNVVFEYFGTWLCGAGILGGVFAGFVSDHLFQSRRGPVAAVLYGAMLLGALGLALTLDSPLLPAIVIFMSMCVIGVHGMLSGTASMDFGGRKNAGTAVGIIDGFVYAGTAVMSFTYAGILPDGDARADIANWAPWPIAMIPVAVIGLLLARRVWHAKPTPKKT